MDSIPTVVVGAGAVGLACAVALARRGRWVVVLEREARYGRGTSSRNSGVIHAGLYYAPGSLKAVLCLEGREQLYAYARERAVPHRRCGKLVVAATPEEQPRLEAIAVTARANGADDVELIDARALRRRAPGVEGVAALWSPSTGVVDVHGLMDALAAEAAGLGVDFAFGRSIRGARREAGLWQLETVGAAGEVEAIEAERVVNSAGLYADQVAALALAPDDAAELVLDWTKGNYFTIRPGAYAPVDCLVYPCPLPELRGLGIHLTLDVDGGQRLGPDVEAMPRRVEDYAVDPARGEAFLAAGRRYLPHLAAGDLEPAFAGIRPQRRQAGPRDFYIAEESARGAPGWIDLVGIESPGLTAALAIADRVARL
jgi:L-2-hydroxyglutarate oxidase LhgO